VVLGWSSYYEDGNGIAESDGFSRLLHSNYGRLFGLDKRMKNVGLLTPPSLINVTVGPITAISALNG
jgi:hypothetical protein